MLTTLPPEILGTLFANNLRAGVPSNRALAAALRHTLDAAKARKRLLIAAKHEAYNHLCSVAQRRGFFMVRTRSDTRKLSWTGSGGVKVMAMLYRSKNRTLSAVAALQMPTSKPHLLSFDPRTATTGTLVTATSPNGPNTEYGYCNGIAAALETLGFEA